MARNKYPEVTVNRILDTSIALFLEKGYEHTTIQDIVDALGDLSKGAIYHHFKSKEDILNAAGNRIWGGSAQILMQQIMDQSDLSGAEKIRKLIHFSLVNPAQKKLLAILPNLMKNPKLLAMHLESSMDELAKDMISPLIREGQKDGSIHTDYPDELAQVLILLCNIWMNPLVFSCSDEELYRKFCFFKDMSKIWGFSPMDEELFQHIQNLQKFNE